MPVPGVDRVGANEAVQRLARESQSGLRSLRPRARPGASRADGDPSIPRGAVRSMRRSADQMGTPVFHWCCPDGHNGAQQNLENQFFPNISNNYVDIDLGRMEMGLFHRLSSQGDARPHRCGKTLQAVQVGLVQRVPDHADRSGIDHRAVDRGGALASGHRRVIGPWTILRARSTSSGSGEKTRWATSTWAGWIAHLPTQPRTIARVASRS